MMRAMSELGAGPPGPLWMLLHAAGLLAACTALHGATLVGLGRRLWGRDLGSRSPSFVADLWLVVGTTLALMFVHLTEIAIWAWFYAWKGCLPDFSTALYFSSATYLTVGYGDVVLPPGWRNLSSAEALTGILMAGLSTGFLFALFNHRFATLRAGRG
jgi:hypothetical protein